MATRSVPFLTLLVAAMFPVSAVDDGPTPLERSAQTRYLERYFLLQDDVKIQKVQSQAVLRSSVGPLPSVDEIKPITLVTSDGVFYSQDYDSQHQLNMDVRPGAIVGGTAYDNPSIQNQGLVDGGNVGSVVQIDRTAVVILPKGNVARVIGVEEVAEGMRVTLEGLEGRRAPVLVRDAGTADDPLEAREKAFDATFGHLCMELPDSAADRQRWVDPGWPDEVQTAIHEGRVEVGMTPFQVVLSWGNPVYVTRDDERKIDIWLFKRGKTLLEQMRSQVNVYFAAGRVSQIEHS